MPQKKEISGRKLKIKNLGSNDASEKSQSTHKRISIDLIFDDKSDTTKRGLQPKKTVGIPHAALNASLDEISNLEPDFDRQKSIAHSSSITVQSIASGLPEAVERAARKAAATAALKVDRKKHEIKPLKILTTIELRRRLKKELELKFSATRECKCQRSSLRLYKASRHQVAHILGKQAAVDALTYEDYFNQRNINVKHLPSFEEFMRMLASKQALEQEEGERMDELPTPWSKAEKAKPLDNILDVLVECYKKATLELKEMVEREEKKSREYESNKRPWTSSLMKVGTVNEKQPTPEASARTEPFSTCFSRSDSDTPVITSEILLGDEDDNTEEAAACKRLLRRLEEKYRNSQSALMSLFAVEVGKDETSEYEHLLDRFLAIYESRSVNFNHTEFSTVTREKWTHFARKTLDAAVARLKDKERNRAKYTEFLFPELAKKRQEDGALERRRTIACYTSGRSFTATRTETSESKDEVKDLVVLVNEAEDERRRLHTLNYSETTFYISTEPKIPERSLEKYAEDQFNLFEEQQDSNFRLLSREEMLKRVPLPEKAMEMKETKFWKIRL